MNISKFDKLDMLLDKTKTNQIDWVSNLQSIREEADDSYNAGELADYEWRMLITKSAKIQDERNDAMIKTLGSI